MQTAYVVMIKLKNGEARYLNVDRLYRRATLIKRKSAATRLPSMGVASIVCDWFWENCWDREYYEFRSVEEIYVR